MNEEIKNWLEGEKNYTEGILLLQKYGKNKNLLRNIANRPKRYAGKLEYELRKLVNIKKVSADPVKKVATAAPKTFQTTPAHYLDDISHYPIAVKKVINKFRKLYVLRAKLHKNMGDIPCDNTDRNVKARKNLSDQIKNISNEMDILWDAKLKWDDKQELPDVNNLIPKPSSKEKVIDLINKLSGAHLVIRKKNLESSLTKDRNQILYQEKTKQPKENPMPPGPKKDNILSRIKEKENELKLINQKLNAGKD